MIVMAHHPGDDQPIPALLVGASRLGEGDLDVRVSWVWTVRAGRIVAMQAFLEERAARAAIASR